LEWGVMGVRQTCVAYMGLLMALAGATTFLLGDYYQFQKASSEGPSSLNTSNSNSNSIPLNAAAASKTFDTADENFNFASKVQSLALLTVSVSLITLVDKKAVHSMKLEGITPVEINQARVAVALPVNLLFVGWFDYPKFVKSSNSFLNNFLAFARHIIGDFLFPSSWDKLVPDSSDDLTSLKSLNIINKESTVTGLSHKSQSESPQMSRTTLFLYLSILFGFGIGTFNFHVQRLVNATTFQVLTTVLYKVIVTLLSRVTHPAPVSLLSWAGYGMSLSGICLYIVGPKLMQKIVGKSVGPGVL